MGKTVYSSDICSVESTVVLKSYTKNLKSVMPRVPNEFVVHLLLEGGHAQEVRFPTLPDFQKWYSGVIVPKFDSKEFVNVPIKNRENEYMVVRPASVIGIRVEPVYSSRPDFSDVE